MSTSADTLRCPPRARRSFIQGGVAARASRPRTTRPEKRPQRSGASIVTGSVSSSVDGDRCVDGLGQRRARQRGDLARDAEHRQAVALVRRQLEREDVVVEVEHVADRRADRRIGGQDQQAGVVVRQLQFARRAQHAFARDAAHRRRSGSRTARRRPSAGGSTAPTSAHGTLMPTATLGAPQTMFSGAPSASTRTWQTLSRSAFGMLRDVQHLADDDAGERRRDRSHVLDLEAAHRQLVREFVGRQGRDRRKCAARIRRIAWEAPVRTVTRRGLTAPRRRPRHWNCARKRRSPS